MAENAVVRTRIKSEVKEQATAVLEPMGLTVSDVMRIVLTRVAHERALPFDLTPEQVDPGDAAQERSRRRVHRAKDAANLIR